MNELSAEELKQKLNELHDSYLETELELNLKYSPALYHYTNLDSAHAIISNQTLRFTNALYLNDPSEIKNGLEIADNVIERMCVRYTSTKDFFKRELLALLHFFLCVSFTLPHERNGVISKLVTRYDPYLSEPGRLYFKSVIENGNGSIYIACLSEKGDDLRQWMPYSSDATGAAIQFSPMKDNQHNITVRQNIFLIKVSYAPAANKEVFLESFLDSALGLITFGSKHTASFLMSIAELLIGDLISCKSEHYKDEAEWRLFFIQWITDILNNSGATKPQFYLKNGILKPFHTEAIRKGAVEGIVLGPKCDKTLNMDAFKALSLFQMGYVPAIRPSAVQYR